MQVSERGVITYLGCMMVQVSSFCIAASASRQRTLAVGGPECLDMSSVFELEISSDSMSHEEQLEAQVRPGQGAVVCLEVVIHPDIESSR